MLFLFLMLLSSFSITTVALEQNSNMINTVYDTRKLPHKEFSPQHTEQSLSRSSDPAPWWVADIDLNYATSDSYTDNTYSTRRPIDQIQANFRAYYRNSLDYDKTDIQNDASHASAGFKIVIADEIIGQHFFYEEGYERWFVETYYE